jgi:2-aminoadipate transaminase
MPVSAIAPIYLMKQIFSDRISDVPKSFIREILKVAVSDDIISFAGGLPSRELFPLEDLQIATQSVFEKAGATALQYSNSEGLLALREFISHRYKHRFNLNIPVSQILITSGSQQGLDLLGKTLLNEGDEMIIEEPGYLGAIQAFSAYKARFISVPLHDDGMDTEVLQVACSKHQPKLLYTVPNFQNPSGISYSETNRRRVADIVKDTTNLLIVEDDPYGDLRYAGTPKSSFRQLLPEKTIMLGSFSKTVVPGFRLGWMVANEDIFDKLLIAKQASDLHTNVFVQYILSEYLSMGKFEGHVENIRQVYGQQRNAMIRSIEEHFPKNVRCTRPEGGMFLWVTLPEQLSSMALFNIAIEKKVAFVPGHPFYIGRDHTNTLRLNFSSVDEKTIDMGINRLGSAIKELYSNV